MHFLGTRQQKISKTTRVGGQFQLKAIVPSLTGIISGAPFRARTNSGGVSSRSRQEAECVNNNESDALKRSSPEHQAEGQSEAEQQRLQINCFLSSVSSAQP